MTTDPASLRAENTRLREALEAIGAAHLGDQPAADGGSELDWALRHIARLRGMARAALAGKDEG